MPSATRADRGLPCLLGSEEVCLGGRVGGSGRKCVSVARSSLTLCQVLYWTVAARLLCPWGFSGKNTGVGCHFLSQGIFLTQGWIPWVGSLPSEPRGNPGGVQAMCESCSVVSESLRPRGLYSAWNSPGQNTGVGSLSLHWGIFPTQGSNPGLPHCRQILYLLSHKGSPGVCKVQCNPLSPSWNRPPRGCGGEHWPCLPNIHLAKPYLRSQLVPYSRRLGRNATYGV